MLETATALGGSLVPLGMFVDTCDDPAALGCCTLGLWKVLPTSGIAQRRLMRWRALSLWHAN
jgi:hypothetical protein